MNLNLVNLGMVAAGGVLMYGAVKNVNPLDVVKAGVTGQPLPKAPAGDPGGQSGGGPGGTSGTVPGTVVPVPLPPTDPKKQGGLLPGVVPIPIPKTASGKISEWIHKWLG